MFGAIRLNAENVELDISNAFNLPILYMKIKRFCQVDWNVTIEVENDKLFLTLEQVSEDTKSHRIVTNLNVCLRNWLVDENSARSYEIVRAFPDSFDYLDKAYITTLTMLNVGRKVFGKNKMAYTFLNETSSSICQLDVTCDAIHTVGTLEDPIIIYAKKQKN